MDAAFPIAGAQERERAAPVDVVIREGHGV
jgi:hypothetical protein